MRLRIERGKLSMERSSKVNKFIICCKCGDMPSFSMTSFKLMFKDQKVPKIFLQPNLHRDIEQFPKESNIYRYIKDTLVGNKEKFSYYFEIDDEGRVTAQYNLVTGKKVI